MIDFIAKLSSVSTGKFQVNKTIKLNAFASGIKSEFKKQSDNFPNRIT